MSILDHPIWPVLEPYINDQVYGRDGGPDHPRHRFDVHPPTDGVLLRRFLATTMPCVTCGTEIHPIRSRAKGRGQLYYAATCPLDVTYGCARSRAARTEYARLKLALEGRRLAAALQTHRLF